MTMGRISVVAFWICISHVKCSVDQVFAIKGCNATLEWVLGNSTFMDHVTDIRVLNASDFKMAWTEDDSCLEAKGVSVHCEIRKRGENYLIYVVLIYVTTGHNGRYTCRVQYGMRDVRTFTKELLVIDKPRILISTKTIINQPLNITCFVDHKFKGVKYHWRLNGTNLNSTGRINMKLSILSFEKLWTADKSSNFSCEICQQSSCCITSETFALDPYYGPDKAVLDPNKRDIFLNENETFTVKCSADCNPVCSVWWEGYINSNNYVLVVDSFDPRMAGPYICKAKNIQTNILTSETIFLHHAKESSTVASSHSHAEVYSTVASSHERTEDLGLNVLGTGLLIVAVGLVVIGFSILVRLRHKYRSRKSEPSRTLHHPLEGNVIGDVSHELLRFEQQDRPLPIPPVQSIARRKIKRSGYPHGYRKSRSLHTLLDHTKDIWNLDRQSMGMQTLVQISYTTERRSKSVDSLSKLCYPTKYSWSSIEGLENRIRLEEPYPKFCKDRKISNDEQNNGAKSLSLHNSQPESFEQQPQEDLYNSVDEEDQMNAETGNYDYDYATLPGP